MRRIAIVIGGADRVWTDFAEAREIVGPGHIVIAANHAARDCRFDVQHAATMHPELYPMWLRARARAGLNPIGQLWHARHRATDLPSKPIESWGGSSGLLCVAVAFELGCSHIVLAGVPMQKMSRHYDDPRPWNEARQYWPAWERCLPKLQGRVKSLSGWTQELLGRPTGEWLDGPA